MKRFAEFVGRFPFAGKMAIRPLVFAFYQSISEAGITRNYRRLMVRLAVFIVGHLSLTYLGLQALTFDAPLLVKAASALYAAVNMCIVLTQMYLAYKTTRFYLSGLRSTVQRFYTPFTDREAATMWAVTIGCQAAFLVLYICYR